MTVLATRLFGRYARIMRLTLLGVIVIAGSLLYLQFEQRELAAWQDLEDRIEDHAVTLEYYFREFADEVKTLGIQADNYFHDHSGTDPASPLYRYWLQQARNGLFTLDHLPPGRRPESVGNLIAATRTPTPGFQLEAEMALSLNPAFEAVATSLPQINIVYYSSREQLINFYPWSLADGSASLHEVLDGEGRWQPPRRHFTLPMPDQSVAWSSEFADPTGAGDMITCAATVVANGVVRGLVAIDLRLDDLKTQLRRWPMPIGELFVVDQDNHILAHPALKVQSDRSERRLTEALPAALQSSAEAVLTDSAAGMIVQSGSLVRTVALPHLPFRLVFVAPYQQMLAIVVPGTVLAAGALMIALALVLGASIILNQREFITPSQQLVDYIGQEARGEAVGIPVVPEGWRPWFETIRDVFNAHTKLVSLQRELDVARTMQQSILPARFPNRPDIQLFGQMLPAKEVGGDFYDFFWLGEHRIGLVIADVSGKGVPASLFMAVSRTLLRAVMAEATSPATALATANDLLCQDNEASMFVTVFYGIIDVAAGQLLYANGGHPPPVLVAPDGTVSFLARTGGVALGLLEGLAYQEKSISLAPGSLLYLYTDGVTEAFSPDQEEFTEARLIAALQGTQGLGVAALVAHVVAEVERFAAGTAQADDLTSLAARIAGPEPRPAETGKPTPRFA